MKKSKASFKEIFTTKFYDVIVALISAAIIEIIKTFIHFYEWLSKYNLTYKSVILISLVVSALLFILAIVTLWFKEKKNVKLNNIITPLLFFCCFLLLVNSLHIIFFQPTLSPEEELIATFEMNHENLFKQHTVDLQIKDSYNTLSLKIKCQEGKTMYLFPEFELEKISPLKGDWISLIEEDSAEKLVINVLEAVKTNEYYYRPQNGKFELHDTEGKQISLNRQNKIRVNVRNFAEFNETIDFYFYGIKTQGEEK